MPWLACKYTENLHLTFQKVFLSFFLILYFWCTGVFSYVDEWVYMFAVIKLVPRYMYELHGTCLWTIVLWTEYYIIKVKTCVTGSNRPKSLCKTSYFTWRQVWRTWKWTSSLLECQLINGLFKLLNVHSLASCKPQTSSKAHRHFEMHCTCL